MGMKVAVSIPDPIFEEAETLARRLKTSRSEIYARALAEFVGEHAPDRVTETINQVVDSIGASSDRQFTREASRRLLTNVEW
jgi:predicted transcriptional regulator